MNGEDFPTTSEVVAITAGDQRVVEALEDAKARGGHVRAWVVGEAELSTDAEVKRVGTKWPL
jgi:hypothetical protein